MFFGIVRSIFLNFGIEVELPLFNKRHDYSGRYRLSHRCSAEFRPGRRRNAIFNLGFHVIPQENLSLFSTATATDRPGIPYSSITSAMLAPTRCYTAGETCGSQARDEVVSSRQTIVAKDFTGLLMVVIPSRLAPCLLADSKRCRPGCQATVRFRLSVFR